MKKAKAVIFDMDGLMLDTERLSQKAWREAGRDLGLELPEAVSCKIIGRVIEDIKKVMEEEMGEGFPVDRFIRRANQYYQRYIREKPLPTKPGLYELIDRLEARRVPMAVATSAKAGTARLKLKSAGLHARFAAVVSGDQVAFGKPAPDIFLKAARALGVEPSSCIVLEDSPNGIRAAHAAGMIPVMIPDLIPPDDETRFLARKIFDSLTEFGQFISG